MKNPMIIFAIIAFAAVVGFGVYTLSQNSSQPDSMMKKDEATIPKDDTAMESTDATTEKDGDKMMSDSRYVEYSKASLDQAAGNRRVLYFYANWCPICKPADADFKENVSKIPEDVTVIRVNYNDTDTDQEEKDLAKKYGITYQHTFVQIDPQGKEIAKWNGGQTDELLANIK